jgi:tRNA A37 threonylcarbamoyladenosine synthetase subunit TsaC/SUA5/YrdC
LPGLILLFYQVIIICLRIQKKTTVGIRVPDNSIALEIVRQRKSIVSTSIRDDDDVIEYTTDPELIFEKWQNLVDMVIDGGYGDNVGR